MKLSLGDMSWTAMSRMRHPSMLLKVLSLLMNCDCHPSRNRGGNIVDLTQMAGLFVLAVVQLCSA